MFIDVRERGKGWGEREKETRKEGETERQRETWMQERNFDHRPPMGTLTGHRTRNLSGAWTTLQETELPGHGHVGIFNTYRKQRSEV